jgi:hypothetical protein
MQWKNDVSAHIVNDMVEIVHHKVDTGNLSNHSIGEVKGILDDLATAESLQERWPFPDDISGLRNLKAKRSPVGRHRAKAIQVPSCVRVSDTGMG